MQSERKVSCIKLQFQKPGQMMLIMIDHIDVSLTPHLLTLNPSKAVRFEG